MFDQPLIDNYFMEEALREAKKAAKKGEVPVGCVIVFKGEIVGRGHNVREKKHSTIGHAEMEAIRKANKKLGVWQLDNCDLYVTLEPCLMCAGAIIQARIKRLIFATEEPKFGVAGSIMDVFSNSRLNHKVEVVKGVLKNKASAMLKNFFKDLRNQT